MRLMDPTAQLVVFSLDERRYALDLAAVERVLPAVEIEALPQSPAIVLGIINVQGRVVPVIDLRRRFRLPERELSLSDRFILARAGKRPVALVVDSVAGVLNLSQAQTIPADTILPALEYVEGVVKTADGLLLIHDLETFLSLDEANSLDTALHQKTPER
jgi:purine-binding chemotaxis protein CheW